MSRHDEFAEEVANKLITAIENGTAPWVRPWDPGMGAEPGLGQPFNAVTGKGYRGANALNLYATQLAHGYKDERWLTYKQAEAMGCQVRKGSKGTMIEYWKMNNQNVGEEPKAGEVTAEGRTRPQCFTAKVFNGDQIDGMPPLPVREIPSEQVRHEVCEKLIANAGVDIHHDGNGRAFYRPSTDSVHMPMREAFDTTDGYLATALHELAHATGHSSRLNRDQTGSFGSESYAREELRAEIASMHIGERLAIGHDPGQHASYVQSWLKILKDDPKEILRAARDAEKICEHLGVAGYEREQMQVQERVKSQELTNVVALVQTAKDDNEPWTPKTTEERTPKRMPQHARKPREKSWTQTM